MLTRKVYIHIPITTYNKIENNQNKIVNDDMMTVWVEMHVPIKFWYVRLVVFISSFHNSSLPFYCFHPLCIRLSIASMTLNLSSPKSVHFNILLIVSQKNKSIAIQINIQPFVVCIHFTIIRGYLRHSTLLQNYTNLLLFKANFRKFQLEDLSTSLLKMVLMASRATNPGNKILLMNVSIANVR